ncbi:MAG TPA: TonB-dependent receptor [Steroidobacteraceae bacterium]|nr:TonB-dependent receptor [Steroidobacteraceae bacterium]
MRFRVLCGIAVVGIAPVALAARDLDEVIITATRTPQEVDDTLAAVTVFTREQIEQLQVRSIEELLQGTNGMAVGNSGGAGKLTSFFARGTDADHLLVLVDGVRIGSATAGTAALQNLPIEQVDRIEFVRGPRSSLYGSEAVGGVLQVFTRRGGAGVQPEFSVSGGSFGTRQAAASLGAGDSHHWFNVQGSAQSIDGFDACRGSSTLFAGCFTEEPDRDGYRYRSVSARAGAASGDGSSLEANFLRAASRVEYDGSFANRSAILQQVAGLTGNQKLGGNGTLTLRAARAWDRSDDFLRAGTQDTFQGDFNTTRDSASGQFDYRFSGSNLLSLGVDYLNDKVGSTTPFDVTRRHDTGVFAQYVGSFGAWRTEASLRHDDDQQFGAHRTGTIAVGYALPEEWELVAQYGTAFRAPTFNELYYPFFGNATLEPERSRSMELALKGHGGPGRWRVSLFQTRVLDQIAFDANFLPANIDEARIRGVEAEMSLRLGAWQIDSGLTAMDPQNRGDGADRGNSLPRRARLSGNLQAQWQHDAFSGGFRLVTQGRRYDDGANTRRLAAYATVDVQGEYRFASAWRLQARVANLFDKQYETVSFYNQAGRAAYVTLRYAAAR